MEEELEQLNHNNGGSLDSFDFDSFLANTGLDEMMVYKETKPLKSLYRSIKHLPSTEKRKNLLLWIKKEYIKMNQRYKFLLNQFLKKLFKTDDIIAINKIVNIISPIEYINLTNDTYDFLEKNFIDKDVFLEKLTKIGFQVISDNLPVPRPEEQKELILRIIKESDMIEKDVLKELLEKSFENDDLEVFSEIVDVEDSIAFYKNSKFPESIFENLTENLDYNEFLIAILNKMGNFQDEFNKILNEKFNTNNVEELCILLNDKHLDKYECIDKHDFEHSLTCHTHFGTCSKSFYNKLPKESNDLHVQHVLETLENYNHKFNYAPLTDSSNKTLKEYKRPNNLFLLENNIIWNEFEAFRKNFLNFCTVNVKKDLKTSTFDVVKLLKLSIIRRNSKIFTAILDKVLVQCDKFLGWCYIDELHDNELTLISFAIKWNEIDAFHELVRRKARLLLNDDTNYIKNLKYFEVNYHILEEHLDECLTVSETEKTILCFDFSNFIPVVDFYDDLDFFDAKSTNNYKKIWQRCKQKMNLFTRPTKLKTEPKDTDIMIEDTINSEITRNERRFNRVRQRFGEWFSCNNATNTLNNIKTNFLKVLTCSFNSSNQDKQETNENTKINKYKFTKEFEFSNLIYELANRDNLNHLLMHPIISAQIFLKWKELSIVFLINFIVTLVFFLSLCFYCIQNFATGWIIYLVIIIYLLYKCIRLILQLLNPMALLNLKTSDMINFIVIAIASIATVIVLVPKTAFYYDKITTKSVNSTDNFLNSTDPTLGSEDKITIPMICIPKPVFCDNVIKKFEEFVNSNYMLNCNDTLKVEDDIAIIQRGFAAIAIIFSAIELTFVIKSLPISSISSYVFMLEQVTLSYTKILIIIAIYFISFALCFMIVFNDKFSTLISALILTLTMSIGEFNTGDLDFKTFWHYLIFFIFVFFMALVVINLLNGLAVSDVQEVKTKAELRSLKYKASKLQKYDLRIKRLSKYKHFSWITSILTKEYFASKIYVHGNTGYISHFPITARSLEKPIFLYGINVLLSKNLEIGKNYLEIDSTIMESAKSIISERNKVKS